MVCCVCALSIILCQLALAWFLFDAKHKKQNKRASKQKVNIRMNIFTTIENNIRVHLLAYWHQE